jgi:S-adenosylhomocysteine hydrolase
VTDYRALASIIRNARRHRAERFEHELPARESDPKNVSLDRALDALQSDGARPLLEQVATRLAEEVDRTRDVEPEPYSVGLFPVPLEDRFLDGVLDYYRHSWDPQLDPKRLAQAVVTSLAKAAGPHGFVDQNGAEKKLGPLGAQLLAGLASITAGESQKNTGKYLGLDDRVAAQIALSKKRDSYLERMPIVAELVKMWKPNAPLEGFSLSSVQHLFPSAIALYEMLFRSGLEPKDAQIGGKFYSANVNTLAFMDARGMRVHMSPTWPDENDPDAEDAVREMAKGELAAMFHGVDPKKEAQPRFLLLDDGGKLIHALHKYFPKYAHLCVAVEQTTRGIQVIEEMKANGTPLLCPVVNMAQCELKRNVESPLIAESVGWHVDRYLSSLGLDDKKPTPISQKTAVVVGFGATGAAIAAALDRRGYEVLIVDNDPKKLEEAKEKDYGVAPREEALKEADLLVGATGRGAITRDEWKLLKDGAILANAASGTHELGLKGEAIEPDPKRVEHHDGSITTRFGNKELRVGRSVDDPRLEHRVIRVEGKELLLLRGGAVVNMEHDLPPEYRQIIVGMLLASCFQAASETEAGLHDLREDVQSFLLTRFEKALAKEGLSLDEPKLDSVSGPWG